MPLNLFDLADPEQLRLAFAPGNHRWLPSAENLSRPHGASDLLDVPGGFGLIRRGYHKALKSLLDSGLPLIVL